MRWLDRIRIRLWVRKFVPPRNRRPRRTCDRLLGASAARHPTPYR
jgi:hypothetical protein